MTHAQTQQPPTKASLKAWWNNFTNAQKFKKDPAWDSRVAVGEGEHTVFGKPLRESLKYASVQISTANANGELYVWGYIPVVVAKCGLYLKENATEVEGTFRVNGSNKRMRELQACFERPPRYGKSLDWKKETYTTHDVASVFRRYLTQMPEPVIPHDLYHSFRDALAKQPNSQDEIIQTYKCLIRSMPRANQYLLLYVLDLLSVFARKSDINRMTSKNLAVIFHPGIISHPDHVMAPQEHQLSQAVLEFLIAKQDYFMFDIPPPPTSRNPSSITAAATTPNTTVMITTPHTEQLTAPPRSTFIDEDINVVPSSEDEHSHVGGGWKLVDKRKQSSGQGGSTTGQQKRVTRRHTVIDRKHPETVSLSEKRSRPDANNNNLTPVNETPSSGAPIAAGSTALGVTRSRTLPSRRTPTTPNAREPRLERGATPAGHHTGTSSTNEGSGSEAARPERDNRRVLHKKNRRTSAQLPSSSS